MQKRALGKGLSAILSDPTPAPAAARDLRGAGAPAEVMDAPGEAGQQAVLQIPFSRLDPNPRQPRRHFDPGRMAELSQSVAHEGVIQPILVTRKGERFEVVAGERRLRAAQEAGLESVPALLTTVSEEESLKLALVENLQRDDLNPIEEARAFQVMIGEFGWTQEELGAHLGRDRSTVSNTLRLLQLPEEVQGMLESGRLSAGHVRALIKLDREACLELARDIQSRRLSVRQAERLAQSRKRAPAATQAANAPEDALLRSLRERIESRLGLPIQLQYHRGRGKLVVSFGSDGELERIMQTLGVTLDDGF